jgi:hypothetical protein
LKKKSHEAWTLWAHIKYLNGDYQSAKERYERVLQFPQISNSDYAHSIYIRLASIYLQEDNVIIKHLLYPEISLCSNMHLDFWVKVLVIFKSGLVAIFWTFSVPTQIQFFFGSGNMGNYDCLGHFVT